MMLTPRTVLGILCCILATSCGAQNKNAMNSSQPTNYYFEMDSATQGKFRGALDKIGLGATRKAVVEALGKPDHDQTLVTKDDKFRARVLTYYVKKWEKGLVNEKHDRLVRLEFDANDHLERVVSNVDGIPSRGKAEHQ